MWPPDFATYHWGFIASAATGYLAGSLPTAWVIVRLISGKGSDIRELGDGNVGATNAGRLMGTNWGILVAAVDMAKGYGAIAVSLLIAGQIRGNENELGQQFSSLALVAGAFAMAGHIWPVWLKFRGGRGAATAVGILGTALPAAALLMAIPTILVLLTTRSTSVGFGVFFFWSIVIGKALFDASWLIVWFLAALLVLVALTDPRIRIHRFFHGRTIKESS